MPSKKTLEKALQKEKEIAAMEKKMLEDASWEVGTNKKQQFRREKEFQKQEEKMQRSNEVKNLLEKENMEIGKMKRPKSSRGKRRDDSYLLQQSLKERPKTNQEKEYDRKIKEKENKKLKDLENIFKKEEKEKEREKRNFFLKQKNIVEDQKLTIEIDDSSDGEDDVNYGIYEEDSLYASNVDDAIDLFENKDKKINEKQIYKEFFDKNLSILKSEMPGLRLSQYENKINKMWKISFENPRNM